MTRAPDQRLADALALAAAGVPVFPAAPDKRPRVKWRDAATRDPDVLRRWWRDWPDSLPAVPTGAPSGFWVADLDVSGDGEPIGERSAATLGIVPHAHPCAIRTRRGGWHLPYRWRADLPGNTAHRLPGVDSRGEGGYVIAWDAERLAAAATDPNLPEPPTVLLDALDPPRPEPPPKANGHDPGTIPDRYVVAAVDDECRAVANASEGQRNDTLNRAAFSLGQLVGAGALSRREAEARLAGAAFACGLDHREAEATIRSGLVAGEQQPRRVAPREPHQHRQRRERAEHHREQHEPQPEEHHDQRRDEQHDPREDQHDQRDRRNGPPRPPLLIEPADYPAAARALAQLLAEHHHLFDRAGPVELRRDAATGLLQAVPLTVESVTARAHEVCEPTLALKLRGERVFRPVTLPARVARIYLEAGHWELQPLRGIAGAPLLRDDGTISAGEGYDPETGIYRERCPDVRVPARPSRADAEAALLHLRRFLRTFPFADAHRDGDGFTALAMPPGQDESAALVALVTAVSRPSLPLAPGLIVRAPAISGSGTGKGKLARAISMIALAVAPDTTPPGHGPEELDKRLVSAALGGAPCVMFDNLNNTTLKSDTLAMLLTERPVRLRPLGSSESRLVDATPWIVLTGNALTIGEDMARRFLVVELDALTEDPEARTFNSDPVAEAQRRRAEQLGHVLTIWRWGRQNAATLRRGRPLGSFETWATWCRDPLFTLGCADPAERVAAIKAADPQRAAIREIFETWWEHHHDNEVKALDLAEPVRRALDPRERGRSYLIRRVQTLAGTRLAGFALEARQDGPPSKPISFYRLRRVA